MFFCPAQSLLSSADSLQRDLQEVLDASKHLSAHLDPPASTLVQSETRMFSRGILQLSQSLKLKLGTMQVQIHPHMTQQRETEGSAGQSAENV